MTEKSSRIAGLDVVRAIAIISVVAAHSFSILNPFFSMPVIGKVLFSISVHILPFSAMGVELFFVLSGFLIGRILIRDFTGADNFSFTHVRHFWARRWFRTLPNYWLILTANILLGSYLGTQAIVPFQVNYYFFLQNLVHALPIYFFSESWSLSVEEWFYLTLPVALLAAYKLAGAKDKSRFLIRVFVVYLLTFTVIRFVNAFQPINGIDQDNGIRKVVLFRLDALMYGVVFAWLSCFRAEMLLRYRKPLLALCLAGTAVVYYLMAKRSLQITSSPVPWIRFASDAFLFTIQPMVLSLCLPYASSIRTLKRNALQRSAGFISRISYSMYLIHFSLIFLPFFYHRPVSTPVMTIVYYAMYWGIVILGSWLIYRFYELPIMRLRDRLR